MTNQSQTSSARAAIRESEAPPTDLRQLTNVELTILMPCLNEAETLGTCMLAGESGCSKSALAKATAETQYRRVFWITETTLDHDNAHECQRNLGLRHPLVDILSTLPEPCLLVFDAVEKYSSRALRLATRLIQGIQTAQGTRRVHFLFLSLIHI